MDSKGLRDSTPRRTTSTDAPYTISGPSDSTKTRHATAIQRHFSTIPARVTGAEATVRPAVKGWKDQTIDESIWRTCPVCQEERRQTSDVHRLSSAQFSNNSESLRTPTNRRIVRPLTRRKSIFETRSDEWLLPDRNRPKGPP